MHWSEKDKVARALVAGNVLSRDKVNFFPKAEPLENISSGAFLFFPFHEVLKWKKPTSQKL